MKILIVNTFDIKGGAARAAYRLHNALLENGINSKMLVQSKFSDDNNIIGPKNLFYKIFNRLRPRLDKLFSTFLNNTPTLFSSNILPFSNIIKLINDENPDIVHLHWITGGMIKIEDLLKIKSPIIWSLHDNWAFTGGCHVKWECENYNSKCGKCPLLRSNNDEDYSRYNFLRKQRIYKLIKNLTIVGLSNWISDLALNSQLLGQKNIICIPNPIDTDIFFYQNKYDKRRIKKIIGFGAVDPNSDVNKGFSELYQSLKRLSSEYKLVVFGSENKESKYFDKETKYLGYIEDDDELRKFYNSVDVFVVPSKQENLSNVIMESMSCGTPVVAFDVGGNSDMIEHKVNGYLVKPFDIDDLSNGIQWVLDNNIDNKLSKYSRQKILKNFDKKIVVKKYIDLYTNMINNNKS